MKKQDLEELATLRDLEILRQKILSDLRNLILSKIVPEKQFYTPKEFAGATGRKYSSIVYYCKVGTLKARQDTKNGCWYIPSSELERFRKEAEEN